MLPTTDRIPSNSDGPILSEDFVQRLETSLQAADQQRWRHLLLRRARLLLTVALLVGPLVAWRLTLTSPDSLHVGIGAVAWLAFVLDVGVHVDTALLSYLGLQPLPSIVGSLLLVLFTVWLLGAPRGRT